MSAPLVDPSELDVYLGLNGAINTGRARMLLADAQVLCEAVLSPLPIGAVAVIKSSAARAYTNVAGVVAETTGPYTVQRSSAGVYLTRSERRTLRSLSGGGGAFSIDLLPSTAADNLPPWDTDGVLHVETS